MNRRDDDAALRAGEARTDVGPLTGIGELARLIVRRDRFVLAAWLVLMALLALGLASGGTSAYPTAAERAALIDDVAANPALLAMRGPVFAPTPGALAAQGFVTSGVLFTGLASLLLIIRHTRADEAAGRRELLGSGVVGRQAALAAALAVVSAANLAMAVLVTLSLLATGLPVGGSVALGLALGAGGIVFAGVGAVAAQVTEGAGGARTIALVVLGGLLVVAGAGDLTGSGLVWWSPFGWARHLQSFAGEQWWVFLLFAGLAVLLTWAAFALSARRDLGAGLVPARPGPAVAGPGLRSPLALAWRIQRGALFGWAAGFTLLGAALGAAMRSIGGLLDTPAYRDLMVTGDGDVADAFFRLVLYVLAQVVAASAVVSALQVRGQETAGLADLLLSGPVDRLRWAAGHLLLTAAGTTVVLFGLGLGAGLGYGRPLDVLGTTLAYLPACLAFAGLAVTLTGWAPRLAVPVTWAVLGLTVALDFLGEFQVADVAVLQRISPFAATAVPLTSGSGLAAALAVLVVLVAGVTGVGLLGLRRRDLDAS